MANNNSGKNEKDLVCSFCGKHQDEVERMIIGPGVNICSECIGLCHDLLSDCLYPLFVCIECIFNCFYITLPVPVIIPDKRIYVLHQPII